MEFTCPNCLTRAPVDRGIIECPMRNGQKICMGCCYDYEGIVTSSDPEATAFYDDLVNLGVEFKKSTKTLRRECLTHQIELYKFESDRARDDGIRAYFREKLKEVESLLMNS